MVSPSAVNSVLASVVSDRQAQTGVGDARVEKGRPTELDSVYNALVRTTASTAGFDTVVLNLYRPAWDDFEVVAAHIDPQLREGLLDSISDWTEWAPLADDESKLFDTDVYLAKRSVVRQLCSRTATPEDNDDVLIVLLLDSNGSVLAILTLAGRVGDRPVQESDIEAIAAWATHAALVLEHAQSAETAADARQAFERLLGISTQLGGGLSIDEIVDTIASGVCEALGFRKVAVFLAGGRGELKARAAVGFSAEEWARLTLIEPEVVNQLLGPEGDGSAGHGSSPEQNDGFLLLTSDEVRERAPGLRELTVSIGNGRGPHAWNNHSLLVPLLHPSGLLTGAIWASDPVNRLKPVPEKLHALRAFANHAVSALEWTHQLEVMRHLAEHDHLTGLRNRRGLEERIDQEIESARAENGSAVVGSGEIPSVGVLMCDLDHFKRVNDLLGYEEGDRVLRQVAELLNDACGWAGVAARVGGEEFALVLSGATEQSALATAEHLRKRLEERFSDLPRSLTLSVGIAVAGIHGDTGTELIRTASRALFCAKRLGRDRSVSYRLEVLESVLGSLEEDDGASGEQLSAVMLLAETLDLRDVGTARHSETVGRFSEAIAQELGWSAPKIERMRVAGVLHDIGKLGVPDSILCKPGGLTKEEWVEMKRHAELGARILKHANLMDISEWVHAHHERMDGKGYPRQLVAEEIPIEARILSVADAYEAMTADRPYRRKMSVWDAQANLISGAGTQFDPMIVDTFMQLLGRGEFASSGRPAVAQIPG